MHALTSQGLLMNGHKGMMELFHVTPAFNVDSILKEGLIPQVGERTATIQDGMGVYLFPNYEDCENALMSWLGEEFDEEIPLVSLKVSLPIDFPLDEEVEWERISRIPIPASCISFYKNEEEC